MSKFHIDAEYKTHLNEADPFIFLNVYKDTKNIGTEWFTFSWLCWKKKLLSGLNLNMYFIMLFDYEKRIYKFFRNVLWESLWVLPQMISRTENLKKIEIENYNF